MTTLNTTNRLSDVAVFNDIWDFISDEHVGDVDMVELHQLIFNTDYCYFSDGDAIDDLEEYGAFDAIEEVRQYEMDNFGRFETDITPMAIGNMLHYIKGAEMLDRIFETRQIEEGDVLNDETRPAWVAFLKAQRIILGLA